MYYVLKFRANFPSDTLYTVTAFTHSNAQHTRYSRVARYTYTCNVRVHARMHMHARVMYTFCGRDKIEELAQSRVAITTRQYRGQTDPLPPMETGFYLHVALSLSTEKYLLPRQFKGATDV